jgi:hypothetical protein
MKKVTVIVLLTLMIFFLCINIHAQENDNPSIKLPHNNINIYISLSEYNINYERTIMQHPKSFTNLRMGFGLPVLNFFNGYYFNPSLVHLTGKKNSHFELDLGFKYIIEKGSSNSFLPDIFAGYRYEKPSGGLIFRVGINLFTLYNMGIGFKF